MAHKDKIVNFNEFNLFIVGAPRSGKTTLKRLLLDNNTTLPQEDENTRGVEKTKWQIQNDIKQPIRVNIWDFGGQSIYYSISRLFYKPNSLYILVVDSSTAEKTDYSYWLNEISIYSFNSPIIIVRNDKENRTFEIDYLTLKKRFSNIIQSINANFRDLKEFAVIYNTIKNEIIRLSKTIEVPRAYLKIKNEITNLKENYIHKDKFTEICQKHDILDDNTLNLLLDFFNNFEIVLYFKQNLILSDIIIINPVWLIEKIYALIDNHKLRQKEGIIDKTDLLEIWNNDFISEMIAICREFNFLYEQNNYILIPMQMSREIPAYSLNIENVNILKYSFDDFMPQDIIWQLSVNLNQYIKNNLVWRYGLVISINNTDAEIIHDYQSKGITIKTTRRDKVVLEMIQSDLDRILYKIPKLKFEKLISCNCSECQNSSSPHFYSGSMLQKYQLAGNKDIKCQKSFEDVNVNTLFDNIFVKKEYETEFLIGNSDFEIVNENVKGVIGVVKVAEIIKNLITKIENERGLMIGIFGKWGRGKTFLWKHIWQSISIDKKLKFHKIEFQAWKYQETPASWAYLYEIFTNQFYNKPKKWWQIWQWLKFGFRVIAFNLKRKGFRPILNFILTIGVGIFVFFISELAKDTKIAQKTIENYKSIYLIGQITLSFGLLTGLIAYFKKEYGTKATDLFKKYTTKHSYKNLLGIQAEIENELELLLKFWSRIESKSKRIHSFLSLDKKIMLFVDDIDRCSEDRIIQVVDALKILLENSAISKRLIILAAIDERVLKRAIENKYKALLKDIPDNKKILNNITREYIDKLFLLGIKLGKLNTDEKTQIFDNYVGNNIKILKSVPFEEQNKKDFQRIDKTNSVKPDNEPEKEKLNTDTSPKDEQSVENENKTYIYNQTKEYEITSIERNNIVKYLNLDFDLTPRTIRIFYNRYLLAKNLLLNLKLESKREQGIWLEIEQEKGILAALILEFSYKYEIELLHNYMLKVKDSKDQIIKTEISGHDFTIDKMIFYKLLEVVEIVVPY